MSDISILEEFRETHGQPFAVKAEPVADDDHGGGWDVTLMPEIEAISVQMYADEVFLDGEEITSDMGEGWMGECTVKKVWYISHFQGHSTMLELVSKTPLMDDEPFEIEKYNMLTGNMEDLVSRVERNVPE